MKLYLSPDQTLSIDSDLVSLLDARPVVNGAIAETWQAEVVAETAGEILVHYHLPEPGCTFGMRAYLDPQDKRGRLIYWVEGLPSKVALDSFGLCFQRIENLRLYLRNGYTSWDGSYYVDPEGLHDFEMYEARPETGYAMTQLLPRQEAGSLVLGFDRHDRFQQTFTFDTRAHPPSLMILTLWDQKARQGMARCESEQLVIFEHPRVEDALREWARLVAAACPTPPRLSHPPITGWCSWYSLYAYINEANILQHLRGAAETARQKDLPMRFFQIDDGFTPEMGDWLEVKPQFPRGMQPLLDDVRKAGLTPGLWIAPFMVGNRSRLYAEHPDWVVQDRQTGGPLAQWKLYGEFRWHKRSEEYYILDTTHPDAFAYLQQVFHTWRWEWGCEYFKTDFMHFGSEHGPQRAAWRQPGMTRIEIWRRVAEMIREEIGDATWLGCGCPLWAPVGLVDGIRIGGDVGVEWAGNLSAQSLLRDQATRNFANHIFWQADPDCVLLRERYHHLTATEVHSLALYAGMSGGVMMTSDALDELSEQRLRLWKLLLGTERRTCRYPFLGQTSLTYQRLAFSAASQPSRHIVRPADPVLVQVRTTALGSGGSAGVGETAAVFIFNTGEQILQRTYSLASLGLQAPQYVYDWTAGRPWPEPVERLSVTLQPHGGVLLFTGPQPILDAPERLP